MNHFNLFSCYTIVDNNIQYEMHISNLKGLWDSAQPQNHWLTHCFHLVRKAFQKCCFAKNIICILLTLVCLYLIHTTFPNTHVAVNAIIFGWHEHKTENKCFPLEHCIPKSATITPEIGYKIAARAYKFHAPSLDHTRTQMSTQTGIWQRPGLSKDDSIVYLD